mmetsp:Transcript_33138/g.94200  ORF Transcript_33138/g.94200 Transcript_33138/m.94200 type:complete len:226 (+) Transcript_33138:621-1298(+)
MPRGRAVVEHPAACGAAAVGQGRRARWVRHSHVRRPGLRPPRPRAGRPSSLPRRWGVYVSCLPGVEVPPQRSDGHLARPCAGLLRRECHRAYCSPYVLFRADRHLPQRLLGAVRGELASRLRFGRALAEVRRGPPELRRSQHHSSGGVARGSRRAPGEARRQRLQGVRHHGCRIRLLADRGILRVARAPPAVCGPRRARRAHNDGAGRALAAPGRLRVVAVRLHA